MRRRGWLFFGVSLFAVQGSAWTQVTPAPNPGKPVVSRIGEAPADRYPTAPITNAEREAVAILSTALDLQIDSIAAGLKANAVIQLRNISAVPLTRVSLQISSTLRYQSVSTRTARGLLPVPFTQAPIATDTDHTGYAQEAVLALPELLAPNATLTLTVFYTGTIRQSAARLELLGTPNEQAAAADWDAIDPAQTALRGFGNVLWYPVAAPTALIGEANRLFEVIAGQRQRQTSAYMQLRVSIQNQEEPPTTAIFNDQAKPMAIIDRFQASQADDAPSGFAQAEFTSMQVGFRIPDLFLLSQPAVPTQEKLLTLFTSAPAAATQVTDGIDALKPVFSQWLGPEPNRTIAILDHPGQPFQQGALLVAPLGSTGSPGELTPELIESLSHIWFSSVHPWMSEGISQFLGLLWTERTRGRLAVVAQLQNCSNLIALAEPDLRSKTAMNAEPLLRASSPVFVRTKAASVFWQLRDIVGDLALQRAFQQYREQQAASPAFDSDPAAFQHTLEHAAKRDLSWFFADWVYQDRSLPDLTIVSVSPRVLPARPGRPPGYLVAVEVRNEGAAVAEVPVIIRSGMLIASERLRISGHSSASTRIVFEGIPDSVQVNDGTVPELGTNLHTQRITVSGPG